MAQILAPSRGSIHVHQMELLLIPLQLVTLSFHILSAFPCGFTPSWNPHLNLALVLQIDILVCTLVLLPPYWRLPRHLAGPIAPTLCFLCCGMLPSVSILSLVLFLILSFTFLPGSPITWAPQE